MEKNFSGYCRVLDGSRLVFLEQDDDGTWEADCNYDADCPFPINRKSARRKEFAAGGERFIYAPYGRTGRARRGRHQEIR